MEIENNQEIQALLQSLDAWYSEHASSMPNGKGKDVKPSDFSLEQVLMGLVVEMEHTSDEGTAMQIALDHLSEDPEYYTKLKDIHSEDLDEFGLPQ